MVWRQYYEQICQLQCEENTRTIAILFHIRTVEEILPITGFQAVVRKLFPFNYFIPRYIYF